MLELFEILGKRLLPGGKIRPLPGQGGYVRGKVLDVIGQFRIRQGFGQISQAESAARPSDSRFETAERIGVRIVFLDGGKAGGVREKGQRVVRLKNTAASAYADDGVQTVHMAYDADELHFGYSHGITSYC